MTFCENCEKEKCPEELHPFILEHVRDCNHPTAKEIREIAREMDFAGSYGYSKEIEKEAFEDVEYAEQILDSTDETELVTLLQVLDQDAKGPFNGALQEHKETFGV